MSELEIIRLINKESRRQFKSLLNTIIVDEEIETYISKKNSDLIKNLCIKIPEDYYGKPPEYYSQFLVLSLVDMLCKGELILKTND